MDKTWTLYLLENEPKTRTYVGVTKDLKRRLRQHNKELVGGAKYTARFGPWTLYFSIPELTKTEAYSLESRVKKSKKRGKA